MDTKYGEPWYITESGYVDSTPPGAMDDKQAERRDRIVACVNYCKNIPTEILVSKTENRRCKKPYGYKSIELIKTAVNRGMRLSSNGKLILQTGKIYSAKPDKNGRHSLNLSVDDVRCKISLARIICFLTHGEPSDYNCVVDHIDGNVSNDSPDNLRWANYSENLRNNKLKRNACSDMSDPEKEIKALVHIMRVAARVIYFDRADDIEKLGEALSQYLEITNSGIMTEIEKLEAAK